MKLSRRGFAAFGGAAALILGGAYFWQRPTPHYIDADPATFVALFPAPPAADSAQTRRELDELLAIQGTRTEAEVAAARADRKKDITRFFPALGLKAGANVSLPLVHRLTQRVEDDIRPFVRTAKDRFHRLRPYEIEPRIAPCIDRLPGDPSYPSGHSTYAYVITGVLADLAPERRPQLEARAAEFAHQRMVCGVHFASDIEAGRVGALWLLQELHSSPGYRAEAAAAAAELQSAMHAN